MSLFKLYEHQQKPRKLSEITDPRQSRYLSPEIFTCSSSVCCPPTAPRTRASVVLTRTVLIVICLASLRFRDLWIRRDFLIYDNNYQQCNDLWINAGGAARAQERD